MNQIDLGFENSMILAFDDLDVAITIFDENLELRYFNTKVTSILGFPVGFLHIGMSLKEIFEFNASRGEYGNGKISDLVDERIALARKFEKHEFRRAGLNGRILSVSGTPIEAGGLITIYTDITDQVSAENELKLEKTKAEDFSNVSSDWFWETDIEGKFTYLSDTFEEITGISPTRLLGNTREELIGEINLKQIDYSEIKNAVANRQPYRDFIYTINKDNGKQIQISVSGKPAFDEEGVFLGYRGVGEDKTLDNQIQVQLRKLSKIATQSPLSIVVTNQAGHIEFVNPAFERLTGYSFIDVAGKNPRVLKSGHTTKDQYRDLWKTITAGKVWRGTMKNITKGGEHYWVKSSIAPIRDDAGRITNYVSFGEDIHKQREIQQALDEQKETNQLQREFVSLVSHEFRTPLAIIDSNAQRIVRHLDKVTNENLTERMNTMRDMVKRMTMLIDSTISLSQLDEGKMRFQPVKCSIKEIIMANIDKMVKLGVNRTFETKFDDFPDEMTVDPDLMDHVISNLISNASKYSFANSVIYICSGKQGAQIFISVINTGVGIPKDELDKLFNRFYRASTSEGIPGTGIGLHLIKNIIDMHRGKISIQSEVNKQTSFTVTLPIDSPVEKGRDI